MTSSIAISSRFCGPPDSANGGYTCGLLTAYVEGPPEVTLRRPPPLNKPLHVERNDEAITRLLDGDTVVAEAARHGSSDLDPHRRTGPGV